MINTTNKIVANALAANAGATPSNSDEEILAAFRKGCASLASAIYNNFRELKKHILLNEGLLHQQPRQFQDWVANILATEMDILGVKNAR